MIISVASGKGGTGKTTVATNLAVSIGSGVQLLDCDVEEPNAHLFFKAQMEHTETVFTSVPEIDRDKCTLCRKCSDICRFKVIAIAGQTILTFPELCHSCGGCTVICPEGAIIETGRELGVVEEGVFESIGFVHGRLRVGEAMSPPLIRKVRSLAKRDKINIIDAPPGTSCPVVEGLKESDYVILVTEPTPFGLSDLKLTVEIVKELGKDAGIIVNKDNGKRTMIDDFSDEATIPILLKIPYSIDIQRTYSKGIPLVEAMPGMKEKFKELVSTIFGKNEKN